MRLMLQNARVSAFTVSELLREDQQWGRGIKLSPTQIRIKELSVDNCLKPKSAPLMTSLTSMKLKILNTLSAFRNSI